MMFYALLAARQCLGHFWAPPSNLGTGRGTPAPRRRKTLAASSRCSAPLLPVAESARACCGFSWRRYRYSSFNFLAAHTSSSRQAFGQKCFCCRFYGRFCRRDRPGAPRGVPGGCAAGGRGWAAPAAPRGGGRACSRKGLARAAPGVPGGRTQEGQERPTPGGPILPAKEEDCCKSLSKMARTFFKE